MNISREIHPGEILLEDLMMPVGITQEELAQELDVPLALVSAIVSGQQAITEDIAARLGFYFNMEPQF